MYLGFSLKTSIAFAMFGSGPTGPVTVAIVFAICGPWLHWSSHSLCVFLCIYSLNPIDAKPLLGNNIMYLFMPLFIHVFIYSSHLLPSGIDRNGFLQAFLLATYIKKRYKPPSGKWSVGSNQSCEVLVELLCKT